MNPELLSNLIQKAVAEHQLTEIEVIAAKYRWNTPAIEHQGVRVEFTVEDEQCTVALDGWITAEQVPAAAGALSAAKTIAESVERDQADAFEQARKERERQREEKRLAEEKREADLAERKERLLNEFNGERGRARMSGYKTAVPVEVKVRESYRSMHTDEEPTYVPYLESINEPDWDRPTDYTRCRRFEIKEGSRYFLVWDDGPDDLSYWERESYSGNRKVPKYDGRKAEGEW